MKKYQDNYEENSLVSCISHLILFFIIYITPSNNEYHPSEHIIAIIVFLLIILLRFFLIFFAKKTIRYERITFVAIILSSAFWSSIFLLELLYSKELSPKIFMLPIIIIGVGAAGAFSMYKRITLVSLYLMFLLIPSVIYSFFLFPDFPEIISFSFLLFFAFMIIYAKKHYDIWNLFIEEKKRSEDNAIKLKDSKIELEEKNEVLDKALAAARLGIKTKSEFLAKMSHEIRTPMNGIIGATEILLLSELDTEQENMLNIINRSGNALLNLINDILDFSKIEAGKLEIESYTFNIRELIDNLIDQFTIKANEKKLELISHISNKVPQFIIGDDSRLMQVLLNLLSNAIKFTKEGDVFLRVELKNIEKNIASIHFSVGDSGIGIPKEKINLIFESFTQADGSTSREYGGTGLGTTISKMLVNLMNGEIWIESPNPKYSDNPKYPGSIFHFIIPFEINYNKNHDLHLLPEDISNKKVILIDDNTTNLFVLREILKIWKLKTDCFTDSEKAINKVVEEEKKGEGYNLMFLDFNMPKNTGFQLIEKLKRQISLENIDIVILSSDNHSFSKANCEELGVFECTYKPIKQSRIFEILKKLYFLSEIETPAEPQEPDIPIGKRKPLNILLAEDNIINQKVAEKIFDRLAYKITIVNNGQEAIDIVEKTNFDLIFMDIQMPLMSGIDATKILRQKKYETIIVALTANAMKGDREKCLAAGMNDYIVKPFKSGNIETIINKWF